MKAAAAKQTREKAMQRGLLGKKKENHKSMKRTCEC